MLAAAAGMVEDSGLTVSLAHLSYEQVIVRADVPRSASYRVWATKEEFFDDLLLELAGAAWAGTAAFGEASVTEALLVLADRSEELTTSAGRRAVWIAAARQSAHDALEALLVDKHWRTYVTMAATILSLPDGELRDKVQTVLRQSEEAFLGRMADMYAALGAQVGFRIRPEVDGGYTLIAATGAALVEGLGMRTLISPDRVKASFEMTAFGEPTPARWTPVSLGLVALIDALIEPDPDFDPSGIPALQEQLRLQAAAIRART